MHRNTPEIHVDPRNSNPQIFLDTPAFIPHSVCSSLPPFHPPVHPQPPFFPFFLFITSSACQSSHLCYIQKSGTTDRISAKDPISIRPSFFRFSLLPFIPPSINVHPSLSHFRFSTRQKNVAAKARKTIKLHITRDR